MIGKTIANYQITERIGAGGMGEVFRARDTELDRDVAVKVLPPAFAGDAERLSRFEREAKLLAGLNHTNVAAIYGVERDGDGRILVLEMVEGEDLAARLARGRIPVDEVVEIALQIAQGLEAAHEQGVIHRDLKPANVKITPDGRVKVLDFGLAKALDPGDEAAADLSQSPTALASSPTVAGVILGTAGYMSPEQARGRQVDKRADIFAFGIVLMEMLTGEQLFTGETVSDTLAAVLRAEPDLSKLPADTPAALRRLIDRCLVKDARRRLRDIGDARIVLEDIRAGVAHDDRAGAAATVAAGPGFIRAYAGWIVAFAAVAVAVVMMLRAGAPEPPTVERPVRKSSLAVPSAGGTLSGVAPALSPDGRYLAYAADGSLWVRDFTTLESRRLEGTEGAAAAFWSPDGDWIGFGIAQNLFKIPRDGGRATPIAKMPSGVSFGSGSSAVWSEDERIVIGSGMSGLHVVPAMGGETEEIVKPAEGESDFHRVCGLPGGVWYVAVVHNEEGIGTLTAVTLDGRRHHLVTVANTVRTPAYSPSGHVLFRRSGATAGIWALPISTSPPQATGEPFLVAAGAHAPTVSRDGTLAYVVGPESNYAELTWFNRAGEVEGVIGRPVESGRPFPSLSPDDRSLLMCLSLGETREVYLFDVATGNNRRLTVNDLRKDVAAFHPNGTDVYFYESTAFQTYVFPLAGSFEDARQYDGLMADFTSDGSQIVYARKKEGIWDFDIFVQPADGTADDAQAIVETPGVDWWCEISPDDRYLLYFTNELGRDDVYAISLDNPNARWQVSVDGGQFPKWRADGKEIFYTTHDAIYAVSVDITKGFVLGTPQKLFDRPSTNWSTRWADGFDVTSDGNRFVMMRPVERNDDVAPTIVVVQNWYEEFRKE